VARLVDGYTDGLTMKELASYFKIHRTTDPWRKDRYASGRR
jgi:hypothetical protein